MGISLKPEHLKRYKDIALLAMKYGRSDFVSEAGLDSTLTDAEKVSTKAVANPKAEELAEDLERMGPIYVKLGQVLSSRADLLPPDYLQALSRLQDHLKPFSFTEVEEIVEEELGVRISKAFSTFDSVPLATASLGQVHRATLRDGRQVVVKVQRPGIRKQVKEDMEALSDIAAFVDEHMEIGRRYRFSEVLEEFRRNLARELDYGQEARNLTHMGDNLRDYPHLVVPQPVSDYSTSRVLTMDYISGKKITSMGPLAHMEMDGCALADELFKAYLQQILVDGFFHADPHPGNILLTEDRRVALIDLGMVGRLSSSMQEQMLKLLLSISEGRSEEAAEIGIRIGQPLSDFDEAGFRRSVANLVEQQNGTTVEEMRIGSVFTAFSQSTGACGIRMPAELTMLGKTLLNLDEVGRMLDPKFNPNESIRRHAAEITHGRMMKSLSPGNLFSAAMEAKEFAQELPGRVNRILDSLSKNQLKVQVEAIDEATLIDGFQKVANRITTGLVLASLIIGAALLMRVQTTFKVLGYPGLAMLCFMAAAAGGFWLVFSIMLHDRDTRKRT